MLNEPIPNPIPNSMFPIPNNRGGLSEWWADTSQTKDNRPPMTSNFFKQKTSTPVFLRLFVFDLTARTGQTARQRQTDNRRMGKTCNVAYRTAIT